MASAGCFQVYCSLSFASWAFHLAPLPTSALPTTPTATAPSTATITKMARRSTTSAVAVTPSGEWVYVRVVSACAESEDKSLGTA